MKPELMGNVRLGDAEPASIGINDKWQGTSLLSAMLPTISQGNSVQIGALKPADILGAEHAKSKFYRLPEVLKILQVSRAKFLQMVKDGQAPPPIKCGRCSLYVVDEIDKFAMAMILSSRVERPFDIKSLISKMGQ